MPYIGRAPSASITKLEDADQDTKIQLEESSDEDTIRFDIAGAEVATLTNSNLVLKGTTPTLTIGDAGAEDAKIVFDGNAQDFHIGLDDTADDLVIGKGSALGTTTAIAIDEDLLVTTHGGITMAGTTPTLTIGDAGAEDAKIVFDGNAQDFHIGLDDTADSLAIGLGSALGTTDHMVFDATGAITKPLQPAFSIYNSATDADVTGDGTLVIIDFDTETFDQNSDFASDTFTAPVTGKYLLQAQVGLKGTEDSTNTRYTVQLVTSNRPYIFHEQRVMRQNDGGQNIVLLNGSVVADMDASDTAVVKCAVFGGSAVVDIWGNSQHETFFSGCLLA